MGKSATAAEALIRNPLLFMRNNLVVIGYGDISGKTKLFLDDAQGDVWNASRTLELPGYFLKGGDDGPGCFDAFWCQYEENKTFSVVVGPDADVMFTATMTGCSLGVGSRTESGHRLVSHANCARVGVSVNSELQDSEPEIRLVKAREAQQNAQLESLQETHEGDSGLQIVDPSKYRRDPNWQPIDLKPNLQELSSTTFGVRDKKTNDWAFYVQKYWVGKKPRLIGVVFVAGVRPYNWAVDSACVLL
jgi:hypothetical protein